MACPASGEAMTDTDWTPDKIEQLRALASDHKSGKQAGEVMGISRSAAIAAATRYGFRFCSGWRKQADDTLARIPRPHPMAVFWTPERIEQLRALAARGMSQIDVARAMGVTAGSARHWAVKNGIHFGLAAQPKFKQQKPPEAPVEGGITIIDLTEDNCHWPYGDPATPEFRYCGGSCDQTSPYCVFHHALAYQPRAQWRRAA